jgi:N-acetyl-1-D-myo-inositol-2-amino-2-deoxy-alpha-D-glucopyranoside deacetylase
LNRLFCAATGYIQRMNFEKRLLLVHAHPDDETINNGATMAKYVAEGAQVTLVTCTRGEEGEVLIPALANLASNQDDKLGQHRVIELKMRWQS